MGPRVMVSMERKYLEQVTAIERRCFSDPWPESSFESEFDHPWSWFRVMGPSDGQGNLIRVEGFILCYMLPGDMHLINLAVDPEIRKSGLARKMLKSAMDLFAERGGGVVGLEVRVSNLAAQKLYASFGFLTVGKRVGYYRKENEDALVMICQVEPAPKENAEVNRASA